MSDTSFPTIVVADEKSRLHVSKELGSKWEDATRIAILPLAWFRPVNLPPDLIFSAWLLVALDKVDDGIDWVINPSDILHSGDDEPKKRDLGQFCFDAKLERRGKAWRVSCPLLIRELGGLPKPHQRAILKEEKVGVSIWMEGAFRYYLNEVMQDLSE